jgi:hypothetical protein
MFWQLTSSATVGLLKAKSIDVWPSRSRQEPTTRPMSAISTLPRKQKPRLGYCSVKVGPLLLTQERRDALIGHLANKTLCQNCHRVTGNKTYSLAKLAPHLFPFSHSGSPPLRAHRTRRAAASSISLFRRALGVLSDLRVVAKLLK